MNTDPTKTHNMTTLIQLTPYQTTIILATSHQTTKITTSETTIMATMMPTIANI